MYQVVKRDGKTVEFDISTIINFDIARMQWDRVVFPVVGKREFEHGRAIALPLDNPRNAEFAHQAIWDFNSHNVARNKLARIKHF